MTDIPIERGSGIARATWELLCETQLSGDLSCVPEVRRIVGGHVEALLDDVELVATELVTNAVLHGAPPIVFRLRRDGAVVRVEVEDGGAGMAIRAAGGPDAMTGRGLGLIEALAGEWRADRLPSGSKVVWADVGGEAHATTVDQSDVDIDALLAAWGDDEE